MPPDSNVSLNALSVQWSLSHRAKCPVSATVTVTSGKMYCHCYCQVYCLHEIGQLQYVLPLVCCGSLSGELFIAISRLPQSNAISCKAYFFQETPWVFIPGPPWGKLTGRNLSPGSLPYSFQRVARMERKMFRLLNVLLQATASISNADLRVICKH